MTSSAASASRLAAAGLEIEKILFGIEQAIRMVEAQAGHEALAQEAKDQRVHRREDVGLLDADGGQVVDVEEPAIVNLPATRQ